jgi:hypothetical protein
MISEVTAVVARSREIQQVGSINQANALTAQNKSQSRRKPTFLTLADHVYCMNMSIFFMKDLKQDG